MSEETWRQNQEGLVLYSISLLNVLQYSVTEGFSPREKGGGKSSKDVRHVQFLLYSTALAAREPTLMCSAVEGRPLEKCASK